MDLHSLALDESTTECLLAIILHVKHYLIPSIIKLEWHWTLKRFYSSDRLIVAGKESSFDIFIIEDGDFESEIFVKLNKQKTTFLTSSTKMGNLILRDRFLLLGNAM